MNLLEFEGYNGSVEYSAEDHLLHGSIMGIRDVVTFEGADVKQLERHFAAAVKEYLAFCAAEGESPDIPNKGSFNVRLSRELHLKAALYAASHNKKLNNRGRRSAGALPGFLA